MSDEIWIVERQRDEDYGVANAEKDVRYVCRIVVRPSIVKR